jgi:hypothetical protein
MEKKPRVEKKVENGVETAWVVWDDVPEKPTPEETPPELTNQ